MTFCELSSLSRFCKLSTAEQFLAELSLSLDLLFSPLVVRDKHIRCMVSHITPSFNNLNMTNVDVLLIIPLASQIPTLVALVSYDPKGYVAPYFDCSNLMIVLVP